MRTRAQTIGTAGEYLASRFLQSRGCVVIARNVHGDGGEIDLVIDDDGTMAAVEVKTSTRRDVVDRVDDRKWGLVQRTGASAHLRIARYDILTVHLGPECAVVRWIRGAD